MRQSNNQPMREPRSSVLLTRLTDTSGNPSESYHWRHLAAVKRELRHEFSPPTKNAFEPSLFEIKSTERRVRRELYP